MSDRGVSSPIGIILLIGMTVAVVTTVVVVGGAALDDTRANAERSQMENAMSQFSSKASLVSLGESGSQQFDLGRASQGGVTVRENTGNVSLYVNYTDGGTEYISNVSMGSLVYRNDDTEIAYQGGGVWKQANGRSTMVSPPEYHYRYETLTFPIINVSGTGSTSGNVQGTIHADETTNQLYPNSDKNPNFVNPLANGTVFVEIESEYCSGWETFFEQRSQGSVESCDTGTDDTVVIDLSVPFDPAFGAAVTSQYPIEDTDNVESTREGVVAPSASDRIDDKITDCNGCSGFSSGEELENGTYSTDEASDFDGLDIDTSDGSVEIIVNDPEDAIEINSDIDIEGTHNVSVYLKVDSFTMMKHNSINNGGSPSQLITYFHSNTNSINFNSHAKYVGGIYAPNTVIQGKGSGGGPPGGGSPGSGGCGGGGGGVTVIGSVVVENFCFNAGNIEFNHEPNMANLDVQIEENAIQYLHVSENGVEVDVS